MPSQPQTNRIVITNPLLDNNPRAYLTRDVSSGDTVLKTLDNAGFTLSGSNKYYVIIGEYGQEKSEIVLVDPNSGDTNEKSFKVSPLKYSHSASDPVTYIQYNKIRFYGMETKDDTPTLLEEKDIDCSQSFGKYTYEGDQYNFFAITYYNEERDIRSQFSDIVEDKSFAWNSIKRIITAALRKSMTELDYDANGILNWDAAIEEVLNGADEIVSRKRKWPFLFEEHTKTVVNGSEFTGLPTDLSALQFVFVDDNEIFPLSRIEFNNRTRGIKSKGTPQYYTIKGNNIHFTPIPDKNCEVKMEYFKRITPITSNSMTTIAPPFVPILIYYCASQFAYIRGNDKRGDKMYAMFQKALEDQVAEFSGPEQMGHAESVESTSIYGQDF